MNGFSIRVRASCGEYHSKFALRSTYSTLDGFRLSWFAIAVASCAGPNPMHSRSYMVVDGVGDEVDIELICL